MITPTHRCQSCGALWFGAHRCTTERASPLLQIPIVDFTINTVAKEREEMHAEIVKLRGEIYQAALLIVRMHTRPWPDVSADVGDWFKRNMLEHFEQWRREAAQRPDRTDPVEQAEREATERPDAEGADA